MLIFIRQESVIACARSELTILSDFTASIEKK